MVGNDELLWSQWSLMHVGFTCYVLIEELCEI